MPVENAIRDTYQVRASVLTCIKHVSSLEQVSMDNTEGLGTRIDQGDDRQEQAPKAIR